jgi:hypothetical protein
MRRFRTVLGLVAGAMLVLSSVAHSFLGWPQLGARLAAARVPVDLAFGLKAGWQFGGVAMLVFGTITLVLFWKRLSADNVPLFPVLVIAAAYLAFGTWALVASGFDPFFLVFIVPAVLLLVAAVDKPSA